MMRSALFGYMQGNYIYLIASRGICYIGETANLPLLRWGSHFSREGTFFQRCRDSDIDLRKWKYEISVHSYTCPPLESIAFPYRTRSRRYLEHKLHLCLLTDSALAGSFNLLSSTTSTFGGVCDIQKPEYWVDRIYKEMRADLLHHLQPS